MSTETIALSKALSEQVDQFLHLFKQLVKALAPPPQPTTQGAIFMVIVKDDNPDVQYSFTDTVTDAEGNPITDPAVLASLVKTVASDNPDAVAVTPDADPSTGSVHFGNPGIATVTASIAKPDGTILGSGAVSVTVVTGDPAAVTDISLKLGDLVDS